MAKFENLTLSYTQIASIPFKTRKSASGSLLDALSRELTPGQRVALFPSYVNQVYASGGSARERKDVSTPTDMGGEVGKQFPPASVEPAGKPRPEKTVTPKPDIIPAGLIPGPDGKPMRVPDQSRVATIKDVGDGQHLSISTRMAIVQKTIEDQLRSEGYEAKDIKKVAAAFTGQVMAESTFNPNLPHDNNTGYGIYGARLDRRDAMFKWLSENGYEKNSLVGQSKFMAHEAYTNPRFSEMMKDLSSMEDLNDMTYKVGVIFQAPTDLSASIGVRQNAASEAYSTIFDEEGEYSQLDTVYDLPEEATAEPIKTFSAVPYDELRTEYPDVIDEDSTIWDRIDPALKAMKDKIVDKHGRKVGRETLIAADASAKVLRRNGLTPRIVSGGDEHSKNHGKGTSVTRSIDIQAYDAEGNKVHLGHIDPQVRKDMLTASQLSVKGENFRIGVPTDGSNTGMHIQSDPNFKPAIWGYSAGEPYSSQTLKNNNPEYLQLWEQNQNLNSEEKQKTLEALIGPFEGIQTDEPTTADVTKPSLALPEAKEPIETPQQETLSPEPIETPQQETLSPEPIETPQQETLSPEPIEPKPPRTTLREMVGGYKAAAGGAEITDPSMIISEDGKKVTRVAETGPEKISVMPRHKSSDVFQENQSLMQETLSPEPIEPKPPRTTLREMVGGYKAAAGGAEITDPSMIISEDGKKVTRVAETGPEKISVMPRHKSSDVFQENQSLMQEARQEQSREEAAKPDIATVKSSPQMSDFGRSRETGQSIAISTVMPRVTPSANKAFADAKMVGRFNKAGIDGDMGIVYIDRGYA